MSIPHLTLLLLLPVFVAGMYFQFHRHRQIHNARLANLHSLPRTVKNSHRIRPTDFAPFTPPELIAHFRAEHTTEIRVPIFRVEWEARGRLFESYVHADTIDQAIHVFTTATDIAEFRIAGTRVEA